MTYDMGNTDKLSEFREDAKKHGIDMVAPSVNTSDAIFNARDGKIFYAIGAIKGVGQAVAEHIVAARGNTPFKDLADFATRVDARIINRRTLETLVNAGAFDGMVPKREQAFAAIDAIVATAQRTNANASDGIMRHVRLRHARADPPHAELSSVDAWSSGSSANAPPSASTSRPIRSTTMPVCSTRMKVSPYARFEREVREGDAQRRPPRRNHRHRATTGGTKKGTPMLSLTLSDPTGSFEVVGFSEQVQQFGAILQPGRSVVLNVEADDRPDGVSLRCSRPNRSTKPCQKAGKHLTVFAGDENASAPSAPSSVRATASSASSSSARRRARIRDRAQGALPAHARARPAASSRSTAWSTSGSN